MSMLYLFIALAFIGMTIGLYWMSTNEDNKIRMPEQILGTLWFTTLIGLCYWAFFVRTD